jgi:hypothetical protein
MTKAEALKIQADQVEKLRVIGLEEVSAGVLKVTFEGKGYKGFNNKLYAYLPMEDMDKYAFGSWWVMPLAEVAMEETENVVSS